MTREQATLTSAAIGIAAGLAGTAVMMAMRSFDGKYAPKTIARTNEDPGAFAVHLAESTTHTDWPKTVEQSAAIATHLGYGALFGLLYGLMRGRDKDGSSLGDGIVIGSAVYAIGYVGWLPLVGLGKPIWKQTFPQFGGELLRHVAYGVATAAAYKLIDATV